MKKQAIFLFLIFSVLFFIKCSKDKKQTDPCAVKALPGDYFPAFPTSWWNYRNQHNALIKYEISNDYQQCYGKCSPELLNVNWCIQGTVFVGSYYHGLEVSSVQTSMIYSLQLNIIYICPNSFSTLQYVDVFLGVEDIPYRRETVILDTSVTIANSKSFSNVLVVQEYNQFDSTYHYLDYFAKNIGLVKRDSIHLKDTTQILAIENYFIGH